MSENAVPITTGTGSASIAGDLVSGNTYQQIKLVDGTIGGSSPLVVNANGSIGVSVLGAVPVAIISGGSTTPNQSVSGTVGASVIGNVPVNVTGGSVGLLSGSQNIGNVGVVSSIATVIIGGSIAASFTPPANQSVSGTVTTISQGSIAAVIIGGSIAASFTAPPNQSVSGTVQTQVQGSVATVIIGGSISASFTPPANQSVSGTVGASVIGLTPVAVTNTPSISGTVLVGNTVTINPPSVYGNISGSVVAFITNTPAVSVQGTVFVSGSVITVGVAVANQSVSGTVGASVIGGTVGTYFSSTNNTGGSDAVNQVSLPTSAGGATTNMPIGAANYVFDRTGGSVWTRWTGNSSIGALVSTGASSVITVLTGTPSISGTVIVTGLQGASVSGTVQISGSPSISGQVGASIIGLVPVGLTPSSGSSADGNQLNNVLQTNGGANNAPFASGGFVFNGATWDRQRGNSSIGTLVTPYTFPSSLISGVTSVITGTASIQVLAPAAAGQRNYITNVLVTNAAAVGTTVQLFDGGNVIYVGYAAASGGGFAVSFPAPLRQSSIAGNLSALSSIQASVYVSASGYTAS